MQEEKRKFIKKKKESGKQRISNRAQIRIYTIAVKRKDKPSYEVDVSNKDVYAR